MSFHFYITKKLKMRFTLKNIKPILIVPGDPNSIFFEIFFKSIKKKKYKSPLILISSKKHLVEQIKKFKFKKNIRIIHTDKFSNERLNNKQLNLIDIDSKNFTFNKSKKNTVQYMDKTLSMAINLLKKKFADKIINGPINKDNYLNKKFQGMTEYFANKTNSNSGVSCNAPADPYTFDNINSANYSRGQVSTMQKNLSNLSPDIKNIIDGSGGVDGIIGPGFKTAYNMARKTCQISSISNII